MSSNLILILAASLGVLVIVTTLADVFQTLLLPRRVRNRVKVSIGFFRVTWWMWRRAVCLLRPGEMRAAFLAVFGPLSVVVLCVLWANMLILGFALCQWVLGQSLAKPPDFTAALYLSGSTIFTLGFGDIVPHTSLGKFFCVTEAGCGFALIAGVIGYLPVLYQLFSRREAHIMQLDARAGSPPSAITLLGHLAEDQTTASLEDFLRAWEVWSSELLESHLSYPMLVFYRSQHDNQSWLAALSTIMDTCALMLSGLDGVPSFQARMSFAMGRLTIVEMTKVFRLAPVKSRRRAVSTGERGVVEALTARGLKPAPGFEDRLSELRSTYEPFLVALAEALLYDLPDFMPTSAPDNWQASLHGMKARNLVAAEEKGAR